MRTTPFVFASLSILALSACAPAASHEQDGAAEAMPHVTIGWLLEDKGTDANGMKTSHVSLLVGSSADPGAVSEESIGDYAGCGEETTPADGAILTLKCWWAGGGDEFQVRMDGANTLSIDHRVLDEGADIPDFEQMKTIDIPTGALVMTTGKKEM
jgi:hypothetical protein